MTKPQAVLHHTRHNASMISRHLSADKIAESTNFAHKKWDPLAAHKMKRVAQSSLTTTHAKQGKTKFKNPRVLNGVVHKQTPAPRQNLSPTSSFAIRTSSFSLRVLFVSVVNSGISILPYPVTRQKKSQRGDPEKPVPLATTCPLPKNSDVSPLETCSLRQIRDGRKTNWPAPHAESVHDATANHN